MPITMANQAKEAFAESGWLRGGRVLLFCGLFLMASLAHANKTLNIYAWANEIPNSLIQKFEHETGIQVNVSTYDSNETLYAKLRANKRNSYDIICPSAYYVERMRHLGLITKLDLTKLPNLNNIDSLFTKQKYDPGNQYSVPLVWGTTGIYYNQHWIKNPPTTWQDFWQPAWKDQLLMLDDIREVFSMALLSIGYEPQDTNPKHIEEAYQHLRQLVPNIKLFGSDAIRAIMIDEDVNVGMSWNGDAFKAQIENPEIKYVLPKDGFMIWLDCIAMPQQAPHPEEAYQFINFMLDAKNSAQITLQLGYAIANQAGRKQLPERLRDNTMIFPPKESLKRGYFQRDVGEKTIELYGRYWQELKMAF